MLCKVMQSICEQTGCCSPTFRFMWGFTLSWEDMTDAGCDRRRTNKKNNLIN